jgi:tetratricopeptide (TPR) repeat protein
VAMDPTAEENHRLLGLAYMHLGKYDEAAAAFREAIASSDARALATAGLGQVAALRGRTGEARAILEGLQKDAEQHYVSPVAFAMLHATLGDSDDAFRWLDRAYQDRRGWLTYLKVEPQLDGLRTDPRFGRLLERMKLG